MTDPTIRLREIVEADREGSPTALSEEAFDLVMWRLARAVADPAFVENVAQAVDEATALHHDEVNNLREKEGLWPVYYGAPSLKVAEAVLSLLAAQALGEGDG